MKKIIQLIKENGDIPTTILMILIAISYFTEDKRYLMYPLLAIFTLICIFVIYVFFFSWIPPLFEKKDKNIDNNSIEIPDEILNLSLMKIEENQRVLMMTKEEHLQLLDDSLNEEYRPQIKELERIKKEYEKVLILPHEEKKALVVKLGEEKLALSVKEEEQRKKQILEDNNVFYKISILKLYSIIIFSIFFIGPLFKEVDFFIKFTDFTTWAKYAWTSADLVQNFFNFIYMWVILYIPLLVFTKIKYNK